jgi:hypothetical protein
LAYAASPPNLVPLVSSELAESAEKYGMTSLEPAAFDHFGVPLV